MDLIGDEMADRLVTFGIRTSGRTMSHGLALAAKKIAAELKEYREVQGGQVSQAKLSQGQRTTIQGVEVKPERIAEFDKFARKYDLQYSIIQQENDPGMVFLTFRQRDIDKLEMAATDMLKDKSRDWRDMGDLIERAREKAYAFNKAEKQVEQAVTHTVGGAR